MAFAQGITEEVVRVAYPIKGLIDIRGQLARNRNGGPGYRVPLANKQGIAVHWSGPAVNLSRSDLDIVKAEALYHVNKNWGGAQWAAGDGYMYHLVATRDGEKLLCRDLESVLWHCGRWPENETYLSIHVPIGEGQHATPRQLMALTEMCDDFLQFRGLGADRVKGHLELSQTSCPGTLMQDFVYPYRSGGHRLASKVEPDHAVFDTQATHGKKWVIAPIFPRFNAEREPLRVFGYPITGMSLDGDGNEIQVFERQVMRHVKGAWPDKHDVLLDLVGRTVAHIKGYVGLDQLPIHPAFKQAKAKDGARYFKETHHNLSAGFLAFWEQHGGLDIFGLPLSEEFDEGGLRVQYFERARMEWHKKNTPPYDILLGLLGTEILAAYGSIS